MACKNVHEGLVQMVQRSFAHINPGIHSETHVNYPQGEMDLLVVMPDLTRRYYEIKSHDGARLRNTARHQVARAIEFGVADEGYIVTPKRIQKLE